MKFYVDYNYYIVLLIVSLILLIPFESYIYCKYLWNLTTHGNIVLDLITSWEGSYKSPAKFLMHTIVDA